MSFVERRLQPLPKTFAYEDDEPPSPVPQRRTRSWTFSDYVPFELRSEDVAAPEEPGSDSDDSSKYLPYPLWPDTDDEEQLRMNDKCGKDGSTASTLEGSPRSESESGPTPASMGSVGYLPTPINLDFGANVGYGPPAMDLAVGFGPSSMDSAAFVDGPSPTSIDLAASLAEDKPTNDAAETSIQGQFQPTATLPIPPVLNRSEVLLATNPQSSPTCCGVKSPPGFSPISTSSPIGAPSFKLDMSPMSRRSEPKTPKTSDGEEKITTLMLRNIPRNVTQTDLLQKLNKSGFVKLYDFLYLPRDFNCSENKGYAFVNFVSPETAEMFRESMMHTMVVTNAVIQGLEANLKKWCGPRLSRIRNPDLKPFVDAAALDREASERFVSATTTKVTVALKAGEYVLQKARAMMPAVDQQPNTPMSPMQKRP